MRGIGLIRLRIVIIRDPCECGIELPGSIRHEVILIMWNIWKDYSSVQQEAVKYAMTE